MIYTKCVYDKKVPDDGKWILVMRKWPRGIAKSKIDEWYKELGPSVELLSDWKKEKINWGEYKKQYLEEISKQKQLIETLAESTITEDIMLVCSEKPLKYCHTRLLANILIKQEINVLKACLRVAPKNAVLYLFLGCFLMNLGKYKEAVMHFDKAIELKPDYADAFFCRGVLLGMMEEHKKALSDFDKAVELKPKDAIALVGRGYTYFFIHEYKTAKENFEQAMKIAFEEKNIRLENLSAAMYYWNSGVDKLSKVSLGKMIQEQTKILQEAERDLKKSGSHFKRCGFGELSKDLQVLANVITADCKFEQYLYEDLPLFKKGTREIVNNLAKLDFEKSHPIVLYIVRGKLFYFFAVSKALDFKKVDANLIEKAKHIFTRYKFEGQERMIRKFKQFIMLLDSYRQKGYIDISQIHKIEQENLMKLIKPTAEYANGTSTREAIINITSEQIYGLLLQHIGETRHHVDRQNSVQKQIVRDHEMIQETLKRPQPPLEKEKVEVVEVNFSKEKKYVKIDEREPIIIKARHVKQEFLLLEELVNTKEVHWARGFVLFENWQRKVPDNGPVEQFSIIVTRLNNKILECKLVILSEDKKGCRRLEPSINIKSSIDEAKEMSEKAKKFSDLDEIIEHLKESLNLYPKCIEANKALLQTLKKKETVQEKGIQELILTAKHLFLSKENDLKAAIKQILEQGKKTQWQKPWEDALEYVDKMIKELDEIQLYRAIAESLWKGKIPDQEKTKVSNLMKVISAVVKGEKNSFEIFAGREPIKEAVNIVTSVVMKKLRDRAFKNIRYEEIEERIPTILWQITRALEKKRFDTVNEVKSFLIESLKNRVIEEIIYEVDEIDASKQRDMRKVAAIRIKLTKKLGRKPLLEEMLKELGSAWNNPRLLEIYDSQAKLKGVLDIDVEEYWKYYDEYWTNEDKGTKI